jgi:hypothetical protein
MSVAAGLSVLQRVRVLRNRKAVERADDEGPDDNGRTDRHGVAGA